MTRKPSDDPIRADLARLVRRLLEESHEDASPISAVLHEHLGSDGRDLPIHGEELPASSSRISSSASTPHSRVPGSAPACSASPDQDASSRTCPWATC